MTIEIVHGDLFTVDAEVIGHGTNTHGVMGAGIAKAFRAKFPKMYADYKRDCENGLFVPGDAEFYTENCDGKFYGIFNLFSQDKPGADARYEWLLLALSKAANDLVRTAHVGDFIHYTLAIPLIGCGIGGLSFADFIRAVYAVDDMYGEWMTIKVVYNDDNAHLVPEALRG